MTADFAPRLDILPPPQRRLWDELAAVPGEFIDDDSRGILHNAHEYCEAYGDAPPAPARYCAPRCDDGYEVETARRKIEQRAGLRTAAADHELPLRGHVDVVQRHVISGWAQNLDQPEVPLCLDIYADGQLIGHVENSFARDAADGS